MVVLEKDKFCQILPHTADIKFRIFGKDFQDLVRNVIFCISSYMFPELRLQSLRSNKPMMGSKLSDVVIDLRSNIDEKALLYDLINELIFLASVENKVLVRVDKIDYKLKFEHILTYQGLEYDLSPNNKDKTEECSLHIVAWSMKAFPERELKAPTYYDMKLYLDHSSLKYKKRIIFECVIDI